MKEQNLISIEPEALRVMVNEGEISFPDECCGFMFGSDEGERVVLKVQPVVNAKEGDKRRRFEIDPLDYMKAERYALEKGFTLLGVYHTHPNHPAIPSEHDLKQAMPYFSYIIISIINGALDYIRSWRLDDENKFIEENIVQPKLEENG